MDEIPDLKYQVEEDGITYDIVEHISGAKRFYLKGTSKIHRIKGPAIEYPDGSQLWFQN